MFEEGDRIADGDGGTGSFGAMRGGARQRDGIRSEPAAFDEAEDGARVLREYGGAALAEVYRVAEEEDFGGGGGFFELGGFVGKNFAGEAVFARDFEGVSVLLLRWMQREGEDGLAEGGGFGREGKKGDLVLGGKGVGGSPENGDVVLKVHGDDGGLEEDGGAVVATHEDVGLAAVAKGFEDVGGSEQVALIVDEEAVAEKAVMVAAGSGGLVQLIDDGANGRRESGVVGWLLGSGFERQRRVQADDQGRDA